MDLEIVWLLDLQTDDHPLRAHQITFISVDGQTRRTACGRTVTRLTNPRGWWIGKPSTLPRNLPIHCGPWSRT